MGAYSPARTGMPLVDRNLDQIAAAMLALNSGQVNGLPWTQAQLVSTTFTTPSTDWVALSGFQNGWTASAGASYRKDDRGEVQLYGAVVPPTTGSFLSVAICSVPAGFGPEQGQQKYWSCAELLAGTGWTNQVMTMQPQGNGTTTLFALTGGQTSGSAYYLDGIKYLCTDASPGVLSCFPLTVATPSVKSPKGAFLAKLVDNTSATAVAAPGSPQCAFGANSVTLQNLPGLILGHSYTATLLVVG